jgi:uncharacterized RmlC-like cupin family protein
MFEGKQRIGGFAGISGTSAGAEHICMHLITVPPGKYGTPHVHHQHETAIYALEGRVRMWSGEMLENELDFSAGQFLYIPASMVHVPVNLSPVEPFRAVMARTDPHEQESVVLRHELEDTLRKHIELATAEQRKPPQTVTH